MSFATFCVCLELRSLPSTRVTPGFRGGQRTSPPPHSARPVPHGRPVGPVISDLTTLWGFPCCARFPCVRAAATWCSGWASSSLISPSRISLPEIAVGSVCTSSFSRLARRSLALRPAHSRRHLYVTSHTEGFSHFVTSMTAPVASGWSVRRVGLAPTGKRRLLTAHAKSGHCRTAWREGQFGVKRSLRNASAGCEVGRRAYLGY